MSKKLTAWQQEWLEHVERCERSGLTSKAYAQQHGLDIKRLYWSRTELKKKGLFPAKPAPTAAKSMAFVRASLPQPAPPIRAELGNGVVLTIAAGVDAQTLRTVVSILGVV